MAKIRTGFVSNSSSSSYIIICDSKSSAERVIECYCAFVDYFLKIFPSAKDYDVPKAAYKIATPDELKEHFEYYSMPENRIKKYMQDITTEVSKGYVYLLGTSDSEACPPEEHIVHVFNFEILPYIQKENGENIYADLLFEERWS